MATLFFRTLLNGAIQGTDEFGNRYYTSRIHWGRKPKRWVAYAGKPDPTMIPPSWYGWLHHTSDAPLDVSVVKPWQKGHQPNLTHTTDAFQPVAAPVKADYTAWKPL